MPKKISVNFSTLVDLKAELFRKQEQVNRQKQGRNDKASSSASFVKGGKPILYEARKAAAALEKQQKGASNVEKRRRLEQLEESMREEERQLDRSKQRLEEKAKLYEKLKSGHDQGSADADGLYLVNFDRKAVEERSSSDEEDSDGDWRPSTSRNIKDDDDGDWVEYTDVLGRTRKCLRQDLPSFIAADQRLKDRGTNDHKDTKPTTSATSMADVSEKSELLSKDMRRELKRKAWEREEEEAAVAHRGPVHYQHVARGESRELGVGYFAFASDEQARGEQMKLLDDLRQQTLSQRERSQKLKEKRQAALRARLEKVKERKNIKLEGDSGKSFLDESDEDEDPTANLEDIPLPPTNREEAEIGPLPPPAKKEKEVRPWDVGKPKVPREDWTEKRRKERHDEFAPPSFY